LGAGGALSIGIAVGLIVIALLAPVLSPMDPYALHPDARFRPITAEHWFGTDEIGRDLFSRILYGSRISLSIAGMVLVLSVIVGTIVGAAAGYVGGKLDEALMRMTDIFLAVPTLILAMAIAAALGPGIQHAALAIIVVWWPGYARIARAQVLATKTSTFVEAARSLGASQVRVVARHVLPNSFDPVLVKMALDVGHAILITASLSFVGLGAQPPTPDWGTMIATGRPFIMSAPWYPTLTGLAIFVTVVAFTLAGDAIQDALDVQIMD
jgi:peptide/nickel transport system permease protein